MTSQQAVSAEPVEVPEKAREAANPRLVGSRSARWGLVALLVLIVAFPMNFGDTYWLGVLNATGTAAIAAVGLNVLTGYAGQISLGHAFFVSVGAFTTQYVGGTMGLPMVVWLPAAALAGGICGALVAPFALRLKGPYLAIVSLGLVFLGIFLGRNLPSITGGNEGTVVSARATLGPIDFEQLQLGSIYFLREQSLFILIWGCLALVLLFTANVMRTRGGRAMQAVRDHDMAAEVLGVRMMRTQANAFILSTAIAGLAGGLLAVNLQYIRPDNFDVNLSVQYLAIIVIGGLGSTFGPVLGAIFVSMVPVLVDNFSDKLPFMGTPGSDGLSTTDLNLILYGSLIVAFLLLESKGLVALLGRARRALQARRSVANPA
ncbi:ABC-type branched-chain amino acid transport system, permease component [Saccharomonospora marina XMU15]|uniref:ABC-type branched-chain amino acid transport system, permease component n=1 Tax=Saccharomonospora marina XMU15 TaxID=882083 RepID=H5WZN0_9PSEU|nr:branched-chain amino acid ABC transporter permease [Saccharomonospora marina]EHR50762.1 ABC-type branched-chain amino acid transport system, permease component [Saccharomonospora marina XMU15]